MGPTHAQQPDCVTDCAAVTLVRLTGAACVGFFIPVSFLKRTEAFSSVVQNYPPKQPLQESQSGPKQAIQAGLNGLG